MVYISQRSITAYDTEMSAYFTVWVSSGPGIGDPSLWFARKLQQWWWILGHADVTHINQYEPLHLPPPSCSLNPIAMTWRTYWPTPSAPHITRCTHNVFNLTPKVLWPSLTCMTQFQVCGEIIFYVNSCTARPFSRHKRNLRDLPKYKERNSVISTVQFHELPAVKGNRSNRL